MASTLGQINPLRYRGYVYDEETELYYLQSRYYDPAIGRFLNADVFASTGQGLLGNNMFAYCGNNPVNGCDPCGTCFHRWDFWNDCEKCGGKTIRDKWNNVTAWCADAYDTINSTYQQQAMLEMEITRHQNEMIADVGKSMWEAYKHSNELQVQQQIQKDKTVIIMAEFAQENPAVAADMFFTIVGLAALYYGTLGLCGVIAMPAAVSAALNIGGGISTVWGSVRTIEAVFKQWWDYYEESMLP